MKRTMFSGAFGPRRTMLGAGHDAGNLEWWGYQQTFIPQLYFARPRVKTVTLGQKQPPPPGVCCQATRDGGVICSTGKGFPPG